MSIAVIVNIVVPSKTGFRTWTRHSIPEAEGLLNAEREVFKQLLEQA